MALELYKDIDFFRRYNDPQKTDCRDISLKLRLTNRCNFNCHYCPYRDNSVGFLEWKYLERMINFVDILDNQYFYIYLHGGEPTLHPDFIRFVRILNNNLSQKNVDYFIYFDTNFTISEKRLREFLSVIDCSKFKINCTYHRDQSNDIEKFLYKYEVLKDYNIQKQLNIMFQYQYFSQLQDLFYRIRDLGHSNVVPKPIQFDGEELKYSISQKNFFYENDPRLFYFVKNGESIIFSLNQVELDELNDFSFLRCDYGMKNIVIDVDGSLYFCVAHQLNRIRSELATVSKKEAMNIFNQNLLDYYNLNKPGVCLYTKCSACDLRILKRGRYFKVIG